MKDMTLTEEMFLLAVWKLGENAYGVTIRKYVSKETGRIYPYGTLYSALDKLTNKGYLKKNTGDPIPERGGRRKNYYTIAPSGIAALKNALELKRVMWDPETETALSKAE